MKRTRRASIIDSIDIVYSSDHDMNSPSTLRRETPKKIDNFFAPIKKNLFPSNENNSSANNCFCIVDDDDDDYNEEEEEKNDVVLLEKSSPVRKTDSMQLERRSTESMQQNSSPNTDSTVLSKAATKVLTIDENLDEDDILEDIDSIPTVEDKQRLSASKRSRTVIDDDDDDDNSSSDDDDNDILEHTPKKKKLNRLRRTSSLEKKDFQAFYNTWKRNNNVSPRVIDDDDDDDDDDAMTITSTSSSTSAVTTIPNKESENKDPFSFLDDCLFNDDDDTNGLGSEHDDGIELENSSSRKRLRKTSDVITSSIVIDDDDDDDIFNKDNYDDNDVNSNSDNNNDDDDVEITSETKPNKGIQDDDDNENAIMNTNNKNEEEEEEEEEEVDSIEGIMNMCENCSTKLYNFIEKYRKPKLSGVTSSTQCTASQLQSASNQEGQPELQPSILKGELKNYQLVGMNWLYLIHRFDMNGILADEMGLGKTVQAIAFLSLLYEKGIGGPHLILVPASTLENWERELQLWCPTLKVLVYYGSLKERGFIQDSVRASRDLQCGKPISSLKYNVVLTTYSMACSKYDRSFFLRSDFEYMIIDEAQNIKNAKSMRFEKLLRIPSQRRILLTGTPLQNNLNELWALIHFLMPDIISHSTLRKYAFVKGDEDRSIERMKKILSPFILRRLKSQILTEMVPKTRVVVECEMPEEQHRLYTALMSTSKSRLSKISTKGNDGGSDSDTITISSSSPSPSVTPSVRNSSSLSSSMGMKTRGRDKESGCDVINLDSDNDSEDNGTEILCTESSNSNDGKGKSKPKTSGYVDCDNSDDAYDVIDLVDDDIDIDNDGFTSNKHGTKNGGDNKGTSYAHIVNNIVMQLRKMANHPMLSRSFYSDDTIRKISTAIVSNPHNGDMRFSGMTASMVHEVLSTWSDFDVHSLCCDKVFLHEYRLLVDDLFCSGKLSKLREMLLGTLREKKVLVFSQMTRVLDIIEIALRYDGVSYLRLDGSTPVGERQTLMDKFNEKSGAYVFLLSTRAAGVGINLASADTVVFYDISFNPQVDRQAEDRCHRIGQKNPVTIYKLISKDTIDESMLKLAADKQVLHDKVFEEGKFGESQQQSQKITVNKKKWMTEILSSLFVSKK